MCLAGRDAVVSMPTYNVSRGAYRVETPDPDDELYASGVGVHDDPEMIARVAATKKYRRDMEKRRLELKEDNKNTINFNNILKCRHNSTYPITYNTIPLFMNGP